MQYLALGGQRVAIDFSGGIVYKTFVQDYSGRSPNTPCKLTEIKLLSAEPFADARPAETEP